MYSFFLDLSGLMGSSRVGGALKSFIRESSSVRSNPLRFYIPFFFYEKGAAFVYLVLTNYSPFTFLVWNVLSVLSGGNALTFNTN